jgi:lysophospholipase L1-like esterase
MEGRRAFDACLSKDGELFMGQESQPTRRHWFWFMPASRPGNWLAGSLILLLLGIGSVEEARASSSTVAIMPLGDSITYGYGTTIPSTPGGYRSTLYKDLTGAGYNVQMVGSSTLNPDPTLPAAANSHEGHVGYLIAGSPPYSSFSLNGANIDSWLAPGNGVNPNLVLLEIGTNEIQGSYHVTSAPFELAALVTHILELRPKAEVLVSTITPLANATTNAEAQTFNNALSGPTGIIAQLQAQGENVQLVNAGGSLSVSDLSADGVHPSAAGYQKLGNAWATAVEEALAVPVVAPEPSTFALFGVGLLALIPIARARSRALAKA